MPTGSRQVSQLCRPARTPVRDLASAVRAMAYLVIGNAVEGATLLPRGRSGAMPTGLMIVSQTTCSASHFTVQSVGDSA